MIHIFNQASIYDIREALSSLNQTKRSVNTPSKKILLREQIDGEKWTRVRTILIFILFSSPRFTNVEKFQRFIFVLITKPQRHATIQKSDH